jgi:hypothetical protein
VSGFFPPASHFDRILSRIYTKYAWASLASFIFIAIVTSTVIIDIGKTRTQHRRCSPEKQCCNDIYMDNSFLLPVVVNCPWLGVSRSIIPATHYNHVRQHMSCIYYSLFVMSVNELYDLQIYIYVSYA